MRLGEWSIAGLFTVVSFIHCSRFGSSRMEAAFSHIQGHIYTTATYIC